jgi:hypothetical protein
VCVCLSDSFLFVALCVFVFVSLCLSVSVPLCLFFFFVLLSLIFGLLSLLIYVFKLLCLCLLAWCTLGLSLPSVHTLSTLSCLLSYSKSPEPKKKKVKKGDTLVALALKFGVSVNQIFFWNPHLVPLPDLGGKVSLARTHARTHARMNAVMRTHALARARARLLLRLNHLV